MTVEVMYDGRTVWINDGGCCIGRFSKMGIDVHHGMTTQMRLGVSCLDCKAGPTTITDWRAFTASMLEHYGVAIEEKCMPTFLRTP